MADAQIFDGEFQVRFQLRRASRTADAATQAAIAKALADPNYCADTAASLMDRATALAAASGAVAAGSIGPILQQFLQLLIQNLPAIIAIIMSLFGA